MAKKKDYCTLFPEGNWANCCKDHDEDYSAGSGVSRKKADKKLRKCIEYHGKPNIAAIVYWGVRAFGWLHYKE